MSVPKLVVPTAIVLLCCLTAASNAAPTLPPAAFAGPESWSRVDIPSPTTTRTIVQWHIAGDTSTSVTYIKDDAGVYADTVALVEKNFADNAIKPNMDKDAMCGTEHARIVEFTTGPDGSHTIINRMIVSGTPGITTITYTRAEGNAFDADVKKAESSFCGLP